ncbi:hypothetical protein FDA33_05080 [Clostridium botulinum]|nr:hypothetical protein [Clostridium botulinum]NFI18855.1 hypothetical protein [Clostridium botulinum]NFI53354.1 hypothetical protein [Clostridium botulinum]NFL93254.1 hypothetical protein [Clostridium botulinum]NFN51429.1 hypothetical protein [Clostridium botulinum]
MRAIFKRRIIIIGVVFAILLIWGDIRENSKVKLYEELDGNRITSLGIHTPFNDIEADNKSEVLEIVNDLKELTFYKRSNLMPANNTPDAWIVLKDENCEIIDRLVVYGDFVVNSKDGNKYEFDYSALDDLCKKYK